MEGEANAAAAEPTLPFSVAEALLEVSAGPSLPSLLEEPDPEPEQQQPKLKPPPPPPSLSRRTERVSPPSRARYSWRRGRALDPVLPHCARALRERPAGADAAEEDPPPPPPRRGGTPPTPQNLPRAPVGGTSRGGAAPRAHPPRKRDRPSVRLGSNSRSEGSCGSLAIPLHASRCAGRLASRSGARARRPGPARRDLPLARRSGQVPRARGDAGPRERGRRRRRGPLFRARRRGRGGGGTDTSSWSPASSSAGPVRSARAPVGSRGRGRLDARALPAGDHVRAPPGRRR
jgi:hypothetical protein